MNLDGIDVYVMRSRWVNKTLIESPVIHDILVEKLTHLIQHPDYPAYLQRKEIKFVRRIRIKDDARVYARLHTKANTLIILALVGRGEIKRDEISGALDYDFVAYLQQNMFDPYPPNCIPWEAPVVHAPQLEQTVLPPQTPTPLAISQEEALSVLFSMRPTRGPNADITLTPFAEAAAIRAEKTPPGDKLLIPFPPTINQLDADARLKIMTDVTKALKFYNLNFSVRYDALTSQMLLVPPSRINIYCTSPRRITHPQEVLYMSEQPQLPPEAIVPPTPPTQEPVVKLGQKMSAIVKNTWANLTPEQRAQRIKNQTAGIRRAYAEGRGGPKAKQKKDMRAIMLKAKANGAKIGRPRKKVPLLSRIWAFLTAKR